MDHGYPKYFYKYRQVSCTEDLRLDYSLTNLINNESIFSSRLNFNDLFDSKIKLVNPTPKEIKILTSSLKKAEKQNLNNMIYKGKLTTYGEKLLQDIGLSFEEEIDSYPFMCLSSRADSNLMWSHYADSHKGFCIEFKSKFIRAKKVRYSDTIPQLKTIEFLKMLFCNERNEELGDYILSALCTKLKEWEYEAEYRLVGAKSITKFNGPPYFKKVSYGHDWVESIIFGCRTSQDVKNHIIKSLPTGTKFKQATPGSSKIEIIPFQG
ncbi:DUF2971 domain-containing protein [Pantoea ananatis]